MLTSSCDFQKVTNLLIPLSQIPGLQFTRFYVLSTYSKNSYAQQLKVKPLKNSRTVRLVCRVLFLKLSDNAQADSSLSWQCYAIR